MKSTRLVWRNRFRVVVIAFLVFLSHGVPHGYAGRNADKAAGDPGE